MCLSKEDCLSPEPLLFPYWVWKLNVASIVSATFLCFPLNWESSHNSHKLGGKVLEYSVCWIWHSPYFPCVSFCGGEHLNVALWGKLYKWKCYIVIRRMELVFKFFPLGWIFSKSSKLKMCYMEKKCLVAFHWHVMEKLYSFYLYREFTAIIHVCSFSPVLFNLIEFYWLPCFRSHLNMLDNSMEKYALDILFLKLNITSGRD